MDQSTIQYLEKVIFTTSISSEKSKRCVVAFARRNAISYRHGTEHSKFELHDELVLNNVKNPNIIIRVSVVFISDRNDYIVFQTIDDPFPDIPIGYEIIYRGQDYRSLGLDFNRGLVWKNGIISSAGAGYINGSSPCEKGDSGSAVFDLTGRILGIVVDKKSFKFSNLNISKGTVDSAIETPKVNCTEIADHFNITIIFPIHTVLSNLDVPEETLYEPVEKKPNFAAEEGTI
ncbi:unnamed protein product [Caenorhabditis angaria]|uniref:Peptidase S1 domain-containing protein n=1 Tax=Caenorhabditis angaria TaxID=860376 RepID=A0A9P1IK04_9PELO|nr:unnamed protein product [Caenorhabditis angaria]